MAVISESREPMVQPAASQQNTFKPPDIPIGQMLAESVKLKDLLDLFLADRAIAKKNMPPPGQIEAKVTRQMYDLLIKLYGHEQ